MILTHRGERPVIPESAYVAPSAVLCGAVTLGERVRVLHGAVLTAEDGEIWIGDDVVIMENALVRSRSRHPVSIGTAVLIGPHAHLNGTTVEDEVFIATGASLFPGSVAARGSELRINSVLHINSRLLPETIIPIGWIAVDVLTTVHRDNPPATPGFPLLFDDLHNLGLFAAVAVAVSALARRRA